MNQNQKNKGQYNNHKPTGASLPIAIGLLTILMLASVAANELILRALRSIHQIESSNRAFMAAEAGIEDALYELSAHFAGYETRIGNTTIGLDHDVDSQIRQSDFGGTVRWDNRWEIRSKNLNTCNTNIELCGEITPNRDLIISLFYDASDISSYVAANDKDKLNDDTAENIAANITTLAIKDSDSFSITFRIPQEIINAASNAFNGGLVIDNDGDAWKTSKDNGINEDGNDDAGDCRYGAGAGSAVSASDADCDGQENEDSEKDPVIHWRISDDKGNYLIPYKGCLEDDNGASDPHSEICEIDFDRVNHRVTLNRSYYGQDQNGEIKSIQEFLNDGYNHAEKKKLKIEFSIVAPLEHVDSINRKKIPIPYLEYEINYVASGTIPEPYFEINSDGYYKNFKQSITTKLTPKTNVQLSTIIQQQ